MLRVALAALAVALAPAEAASAAPRASATAQAGPLEVTRAFYRALHAGDVKAAARLAAGDAAPSLAAYVRIARAHRELEAAVARRFGREEAGRVGYGNKVQAEVKALLGAEERIDGDEAQVAALDGRVLATLVRAGKSWKVELDDDVAAPGGAAKLRRDAAVTERESRRVTAAIRAGKYDDAVTAVRDFQAAVAKATGADAPAAAQEEQGTQL